MVTAGVCTQEVAFSMQCEAKQAGGFLRGHLQSPGVGLQETTVQYVPLT